MLLQNYRYVPRCKCTIALATIKQAGYDIDTLIVTYRVMLFRVAETTKKCKK